MNTVEIIVIVVVVLVVLAVGIGLFLYTRSKRFSGGVKTNFLSHLTKTKPNINIWKWTDLVTDIIMYLPAGYAAECYKILTSDLEKNPDNTKYGKPEKLHELRRLCNIPKDDDEKQRKEPITTNQLKELQQAIKEHITRNKLESKFKAIKDNVKQSVVVNCLHLSDISRRNELDRKEDSGFDSRKMVDKPMKYNSYVAGVEALLCLYYYDKMEVKCLEYLGSGGFNSVFKCVYRKKDKDIYYALRLNRFKQYEYKHDKVTYVADFNESLNQFIKTCEMIKGNKFFTSVYHGSYEYKHIIGPKDKNDNLPEMYFAKGKEFDHPVCWMLTDVYESIRRYYLTDDLITKYYNSMVQVIDFIHKHNMIYVDWKYSNFMYNADSGNYVITDIDFIDITTKPISSAVHTHRSNFIEDIGNAKFYTSGMPISEKDKYIASINAEIWMLNDSFIALKEIISLFKCYMKPADERDKEYSNYIKNRWTCEDMLNEYNDIKNKLNALLEANSGRLVITFINETIGEVENIQKIITLSTKKIVEEKQKPLQPALGATDHKITLEERINNPDVIKLLNGMTDEERMDYFGGIADEVIAQRGETKTNILRARYKVMLKRIYTALVQK